MWFNIGIKNSNNKCMEDIISIQKLLPTCDLFENIFNMYLICIIFKKMRNQNVEPFKTAIKDQ